MQERENALHNWLKSIVKSPDYKLIPLHGDASFRRYYRLYDGECQRIVMDSPPAKENLAAFIEVGQRLRTQGLHTPYIYALDLERGFALLEDLGEHLLLDTLALDNVDRWYASALDKIIILQKCPSAGLPVFSKQHMLEEMALFPQWFLQNYLKLSLSLAEQTIINNALDWLAEQVDAQEKVLIHRDFHSRNLMVLDNNELGIIDFQDAMYGPYTYDLVSLIKDCYIQWPREKILQWIKTFHSSSPLAADISQAQLIIHVDLTGLQRHLKVLGIFARLFLRDNKSGYLKDLPLTLHYVMAGLEGFSELQPLYRFMQQRVQLP